MTTSSILCQHANEVPFRCHCPSKCYCKQNTCKPEYFSFPMKVKKDGKWMMEIGDGTFWEIDAYKRATKFSNEKCPDCGHRKGAHYGVCRHTNGFMKCTCQRGFV